MNKLIKNPKIVSFIRAVKPWVTALLIFLVLRYTGALSAISYYTSTALLKTGVMDADPSDSDIKRDFDYNFKVQDMSGKPIAMDGFKGKTLFINIWATWCGPCRVEMPSIQNLYSKVNKDSVAFIMLSLDRKDAKNKILAFMNDNNYTFPVYMEYGQLPTDLQVSSIPSTFIVSSEGKIVYKKMGTANYDTPKILKFLEAK